MFLLLNHQDLDVYKSSGELIKECHKITKLLPGEERFNLVQQIRRAALSVKLNIAEGSSRRSEVERKRYYEISRGSLIEIDAALETTLDLEYLTFEQLKPLEEIIVRTFSMLSKRRK